MKIKITKEAKQWLTVAQMSTVRHIIAQYQQELDSESVNTYVGMAVNAAWAAKGNDGQNYVKKMFEVSAEIAGNSRADDALAIESGTLDIWFESTCETYQGFCKIGFYLTDAWQVCEDNMADLGRHMYAEFYGKI